MRVLVVEDKVKLAGLLRRALRGEGLAADVAVRGEDALWMAGANRYDAIVLDVMLPGIDGIETCRRGYVCGSRSLLAELGLVGDFGAFAKVPIAARVDGGVMNEDVVRAVIGGNKPNPLSALNHLTVPLAVLVLRVVVLRTRKKPKQRLRRGTVSARADCSNHRRR